MPQKRLTTNGNVFRRTDGRWQSVIWYFDEQGVKRRKVFSSKTKTEAQQKITTYITQFNEEVRSSDESQKTIKDSLTHWLQVFKFPSVERTTYDRLECTAQHQVFPLIGEKIVSDITAADLKSVLNHWMEQGYAYTTVKKVYILLNEFFRYLTEEDFIQKNPMQSVPMMKRANFLAAQDKSVCRSRKPSRYSLQQRLRNSKEKHSPHLPTASANTSKPLPTSSCSTQDFAQENCWACSIVTLT